MRFVKEFAKPSIALLMAIIQRNQRFFVYVSPCMLKRKDTAATFPTATAVLNRAAVIQVQRMAVVELPVSSTMAPRFPNPCEITKVMKHASTNANAWSNESVIEIIQAHGGIKGNYPSKYSPKQCPPTAFPDDSEARVDAKGNEDCGYRGKRPAYSIEHRTLSAVGGHCLIRHSHWEGSTHNLRALRETLKT